MKTEYQNVEQLVWIAALCLQVVSSHIRTFKERITASAPVAESADPQRKSSFSRPGEASRFHLSRRCLLNVPVVWAAAAPSFSFNPGNVDFWFRSSLKPGGEEKPTLAPETVCVCVCKHVPVCVCVCLMMMMNGGLPLHALPMSTACKHREMIWADTLSCSLMQLYIQSTKWQREEGGGRRR